MSICISQILATLGSRQIVCRTLPRPTVCPDADGSTAIRPGNNAVVVRVRLAGDGRIYAMKCYTRPKKRLAAIYGESYLPAELFVYDISGHGSWIDIVLAEWIEGRTLDEAMRDAAADRMALSRLSRDFDSLALGLLASERAHGDLKPENIVCSSRGMTPVDWDAAYLPEYAGCRAVETGTPDYQHPSRTADMYDKRIDDYPAALISTMLALAAADPAAAAQMTDGEGRIFSPALAVAGRDPKLHRAEHILARSGDAAHYRIARLLSSPTASLPELAQLLSIALSEPADPARGFDGATLEHGRFGWGYMRRGEWVVPPLYDSGFEPTEGTALVELGGCRHFISCTGRSLMECSRFDSIKPLSGGRARAESGGRRCTVTLDGDVEYEF